MTDLLTVLLDIDRLRGKTCGSCFHSNWVKQRIDDTWRRLECRKGYQPLYADDNCPDWKCKHADRNAKLTAMVIGSLCLLLAALPVPAKAIDGPKWASQDPETREWFKGLKNPNGTPCCDYVDGQRVEDPDYIENIDGTFEVTVGLKTFHIDKQHIVTATNRIGYAILWGRPDYDMIYCFMPGVRG